MPQKVDFGRYLQTVALNKSYFSLHSYLFSLFSTVCEIFMLILYFTRTWKLPWSKRRDSYCLKQRSLMFWLSQLDWVDPAGWVKALISWKVGPARRVILLSQKGDQTRRVTLLAQPSKRFATFVRNVWKVYIMRWLTQRGSGRRMTILLRTTFLHI